MASTHIKTHKNKNYMVSMYKGQFGFYHTHKVLTLDVPCSEGDGKYPVEIRRVRVPNDEAEALYQKAVAWINRQAAKLQA